ncbi:hypothetical protein PSPO01_15137 [Paraphaeosphaeria sporulosa]
MDSCESTIQAAISDIVSSVFTT